jgi:hypothetical protein
MAFHQRIAERIVEFVRIVEFLVVAKFADRAP